MAVNLAMSTNSACDQNENKQRRRYPPDHGYKGVCFEKRKELWRARIYYKGNHHTLGRFATAKLAAEAHDRAAVLLFGKRALTNFGVAAAEENVHLLQFRPSVQRRLLASRELVLRDLNSRSSVIEMHCRAVRRAAAAAACGVLLTSPGWRAQGLCGRRGDDIWGVCGSRGGALPCVGECKTLLLAAVRIPPFWHGTGRGNHARDLA
jgi:hypothetical protein